MKEVSKKRILLEALITEREGMLAENQFHLYNGSNIAFGEKAFLDLADQMRAILDEPDEDEEKVL